MRKPGRPSDDTDRHLLAILMNDARRSTASIAKDLGLARTTVHERIDRLEKSGLIAGYTALVNSDPSTSDVRAIVLVAIDLKMQRKIIDHIERLPEVKLCATVNGEFDLLLELNAPLNEDIDAIIDEIATTHGVERIRTLIFLSTRFDRRRPSIVHSTKRPG